MENGTEFYSITYETPLLLYGYTRKAQDIARSLIRRSYSVKGYVDARAYDFALDNELPIFLPDELREWKEEEMPVVILCLQSILTQRQVAASLLKKGIDRIIFISDTEGKNPYMTSMMRQIYQRITLNEDITGYLIPKYDAMLHTRESIPVINCLDNYTCILCPIQLIYTGILDSETEWLIKDFALYQNEVRKYEDVNIVFDKLYSNFFDYMIKGTGNCDTYIEIYARMSGRSKESYFRDRTELFELYEREYNVNSVFFVETAARAKWNPNGYFNLEDGHHRVAYLHKKGHLWIPLFISKKDYELYKNSEKEAELRKYLSKSKIYKLRNTEIENRLAGTGISDFQIKLLIATWIFLSEAGTVAKYSYLDASDSSGFFAFNMHRMHAQDVTVVVQCAEEKKQIELICGLTYQDNIQIINKEEICNRYDVIFAGEIKEGYKWECLQKKARKFYFFMSEMNVLASSRMTIPAEGFIYEKIGEYLDGRRRMEYGVFKNQQRSIGHD